MNSEPTPIEAVSGVDRVLITAELDSRPSRTPDFQGESRALGLLAQEMAANPDGVLRKCAELVLELCKADSAGISVLEPGGTEGIFRWHAAAGGFVGNVLGAIPREASPCGTVIARDRAEARGAAGCVGVLMPRLPARRSVRPRAPSGARR